MPPGKIRTTQNLDINNGVGMPEKRPARESGIGTPIKKGFQSPLWLADVLAARHL
jgi:hypothetical protein